jgi:hypothetical protein
VNKTIPIVIAAILAVAGSQVSRGNAAQAGSPTMQAAPPTPAWNLVPCPKGVQPNIAIVTWATYKAKTHLRRSGRRIVRRSVRVRRVYRAICGLILVQPYMTSCPPGNASGNTARYNVAFQLQTKGTERTLLRITETVVGCIILAVDGRPQLGATGLNGILVP